MKNRIKVLFLPLLFSGLVLATNKSIDRVLAEGHDHSFVNDVCTCGARNFEAEKGIIGGEPSDPNDGFLINRASSNSRPTSGPTSGQPNCVANWAKAGNTITWRFNLNEASSVPMHLWHCTGFNTAQALDSELEIKLNGTKVTWASDKTGRRDGDGWYYWTEANTTNADFKSGINEVVLKNIKGNPINIDNLVIDFPVTTTFVEGDKATYKFEAEDGDVFGTPFHGDAFIVQNETCSNGKCVRNFGGGDNQIFWYFNLNKAVEKAVIKFYMVAYPAPTFESSRRVEDAIYVKVNGGDENGNAGPFTSDDILPEYAPEDWYNFKPVTMKECSLKEGSNTILFEGNNYCQVSIDYMELTIDDTATLTVLDKPGTEDYDEDHVFVDGRCIECGAYCFEAENAVIAGTCSDPAEGFVLERASTNARPTSGGACVGNFSVAGNTITWSVISDKAINNAKISLFISPCGGGGSMGSIISFKNNDTDLKFDQSSFPSFAGGDSWYSWVELTAKVNLVEGKNKIVLTNLGNNPFNIDNIVIEAGKEVTLCMVEGDSIDPTITPIRIVTLEPMTYETIEIAYDYEDNKTAKEDLKVSVFVYFNYGGLSQEKVSVNDDLKTFTVKKAGEYTIFVSVEDEEANKTTRTRIFNVSENPNAPEDDVPPVIDPGTENPDPVEPGGPVVVSGEKETKIGLIVLGSSIALGLGCALYAFIAMKMKMRG